MTQEVKKRIDHRKVDTLTDPKFEGMFSHDQMKGVIDMLWNKGQKELEATNTWPSYRGRFGATGATLEAFWVYNHQQPTPIFAILATKQESDNVWAIVKSGGGETRIEPGNWSMKDLVRQSKEAQAAEANKEVN